MSDVGGIAVDRLKSFIQRVERLEEEKKNLSDDIKEVYAEAKGTGFDVQIMRQIVRLRKMDASDLQEQQAMLALYAEAVGLNYQPTLDLEPTPIEKAITKVANTNAAPVTMQRPPGVEYVTPGLPDDDEVIGSGETGALDELFTTSMNLAGSAAAPVYMWTVLHGDGEIYSPIASEEFATDCRERLTDTAKVLGRDLAPFEVHERVMAVLREHRDVGIAFNAPYDAATMQAGRPAPEKPAAKAGRKVAAKKVAEYHAGYDAAEGDQTMSVCPHARGAFRDEWQRGWADQKDGKPRAWACPTPAPANDDAEAPLYGDGAQGQDITASAAA